jgi:hypothetical protein
MGIGGVGSDTDGDVGEGYFFCSWGCGATTIIYHDAIPTLEERKM